MMVPIFMHLQIEIGNRKEICSLVDKNPKNPIIISDLLGSGENSFN